MKVLITLAYFERHQMVRNALNSIKEMNYDDWELAFIDDGSVDFPGEPVVREVLKDHLHKVRFYQTGDSVETKYANGGSRHGLFMTQTVLDSDADINFVLCDDDAITPNYLNEINKFFTERPDVNWAYTHVVTFNPTVEDYHLINDPNGRKLNHHTADVHPACLLDSSQVVWRAKCIRDEGIRWTYPQTGGLDAAFFEKMSAKYGPCKFMGCFGQYKGIFSEQMSHRSDYTIKIH